MSRRSPHSVVSSPTLARHAENEAASSVPGSANWAIYLTTLSETSSLRHSTRRLVGLIHPNLDKVTVRVTAKGQRGERRRGLSGEAPTLIGRSDPVADLPAGALGRSTHAGTADHAVLAAVDQKVLAVLIGREELIALEEECGCRLQCGFSAREDQPLAQRVEDALTMEMNS